MLTYKSAGDLGDILSSLPAIRYLGGGALLIEAADYTRQKLTRDKWCGIDILLKQQPYISDVMPWTGGYVNYNLNDFRANMHRTLRNKYGSFKDKALCDWIMEAHGVPLNAKDTPWLTVEPNKVAKVVFNRTGPGREPKHVYQNNLFPWHQVWRKYQKDAIFIGSPLEYEVFNNSCGNVPYYPTEDLHQAARVIAGAELFVGNQSACFWIACGLFQRIVLEVWPSGPNCSVLRPSITHGWDQNVVLPDL